MFLSYTVFQLQGTRQLWPVLCSPVRERHGASGVGPAESSKDDGVTGTFLSWWKTEETGPAQSWEEMTDRGSHQCLSGSEGRVPRGTLWLHSLLSRSQALTVLATSLLVTMEPRTPCRDLDSCAADSSSGITCRLKHGKIDVYVQKLTYEPYLQLFLQTMEPWSSACTLHDYLV